MRTSHWTSLLLMILTTGLGSARGARIDRLEASVNSGTILLSHVVEFRKTVGLRAQLDPLFSNTAISTKGASSEDAEIVQFLVDEKIISQQFPVTDAEVEQEINSIQANNRIDRPSLKSALKAQGFRFEDYFELIRASIAKRNLIDRDIRTKVYISDEDVKNYYVNHFKGPATRPSAYRIKIITVSRRSYKTLEAARQTALKAAEALKGGEPFSEVAKRFSDHPSSSGGGDLGLVQEADLSPEIRKVIVGMKDGETSGLLGSPDKAQFIVQLAETQSQPDEQYQRATEQIRNQLSANEYQHQVSLWLQRERQKAFIHLAGQSSLPSNYGI